MTKYFKWLNGTKDLLKEQWILKEYPLTSELNLEFESRAGRTFSF